MNLFFNITSVTVDALLQAVFPSIHTIFEKFSKLIFKPCFCCMFCFVSAIEMELLLHHDNAPAHSVRVTKEILREFRWELLPHPLYSPDLAPSDFFLFPKLIEHLKGVHFNSTDGAKHAAKTWLKNQFAEFFKNGMNGWKHRLEKCIDRDGGYVEK